MIKAVIFDMDGVIARTEEIQSGAESQVFGNIGINVTPKEIVNRYSGYKDIEMFKDMVRRHHIKESIVELRKKKWEIVYRKIADEMIPVVPGVLNFIAEVQKGGYTLALASSAIRNFISIVINNLSIKEKFSVVVSGDEVKEGKPSPEIFLLTAKKLNITPVVCLVIEDAPNGVKAAKAAGMKCIAITTTHERSQLQEADRIINSFEELSVADVQRL